MAGGIRAYKSCGFNPKNVLDVGAHLGDWAKGFLKELPNSRLFMIEANEECEPYLKKIGHPYVLSLVGDRARTVTYYRSNSNKLSTGSLFHFVL